MNKTKMELYIEEVPAEGDYPAFQRKFLKIPTVTVDDFGTEVTTYEKRLAPPSEILDSQIADAQVKLDGLLEIRKLLEN